MPLQVLGLLRAHPRLPHGAEGARRAHRVEPPVDADYADVSTRVHGRRGQAAPPVGPHERRFDRVFVRFDLLPPTPRRPVVAVLRRRLALDRARRPRRRHGLRRPPRPGGVRVPVLFDGTHPRRRRLRRHGVDRDRVLQADAPQRLRRRHEKAQPRRAADAALLVAHAEHARELDDGLERSYFGWRAATAVRAAATAGGRRRGASSSSGRRRPRSRRRRRRRLCRRVRRARDGCLAVLLGAGRDHHDSGRWCCW
mmetsp:Transcript_26608/g.106600  ORF Transcript_26608/g.106600 Transcript_26608/m.106600 type:complete len:254 (-) Transcript_26608:257-1018(-)